MGVALAGCSGSDDPVRVNEVDRAGSETKTPRNRSARRALEPIVLSGNRGRWAGQIGHNRVVERPLLVRRIEEAAEASGARLDDVTLYDFRVEELAVAVRLQVNNAARYLKYDLRRVLQNVAGRRYRLVEVYDGDGTLAWMLGGWGNGGMAWERPELLWCFGPTHSTPAQILPASGPSVPDQPCPLG